MKNTFLPNNVKVSGMVVDIVEWNPDVANAKNRYGECDLRNNQIRVDVTQHRQHLLDSLIHEINHAIYYIYNIHDEDNEERTVSTISTAWNQIYRDNPLLCKYIFDFHHKAKK